MIEEYKFGLIKINDKEYNYDVEVRWNGQVLLWWRQESHAIDLVDIQGALRQEPDLIIFGTGMQGIAKVTKQAQKEIRSRGIELIINKTDQAVQAFNLIKEKTEKEKIIKKIIGLFHLTC